jgi:O-antigen/teichoic acid export membrane protein
MTALHSKRKNVSLRKNYLYNTAFQIFAIIFPLITIPFVAKALGPTNLGIYLYTYSIVALFGLVSNLGIMNYGNKVIAADRDDRKRLSKTFTSLYLVSLLMTIPALLVYLTYCLFFVTDNRGIFLLQSIFLLSTMFDISWFFMGLEKFKLTIMRDVIVKFLTLTCILLFVRPQNGLVSYTLIMATGALISQLALWPFLRRYTTLVKVGLTDCLLHIRPLFALFIPVIAVSMYTTVNKVMLGNMTDYAQVGQFDSAVRIMTIPLGLITAMGVVMLPRMSNIIAKNDNMLMSQYISKSMRFVMFMSLPITFGLIAVSGTLVPLFLGKEFTQAGTVLAIIAPVVVFAAWANVLRTQYLIPKGKNKSYIISVIIGAIVSLGLNFLLIPSLKATGAAIAMLCAEFCVMLYQTFALRKDLNMREYLRASRGFLVKATIMFACVMAVGLIIEQPYARVVMQVIVGGLVYGTLNLEYLDQTILNGKLKHPAWNKLLIAKEKLYMQGDDISGDKP